MSQTPTKETLVDLARNVQNKVPQVVAFLRECEAANRKLQHLGQSYRESADKFQIAANCLEASQALFQLQARIAETLGLGVDATDEAIVALLPAPPVDATGVKP